MENSPQNIRGCTDMFTVSTRRHHGVSTARTWRAAVSRLHESVCIKAISSLFVTTDLSLVMPYGTFVKLAQPSILVLHDKTILHHGMRTLFYRTTTQSRPFRWSFPRTIRHLSVPDKIATTRIYKSTHNSWRAKRKKNSAATSSLTSTKVHITLTGNTVMKNT